jgi:hypothetical protein
MAFYERLNFAAILRGNGDVSIEVKYSRQGR